MKDLARHMRAVSKRKPRDHALHNFLSLSEDDKKWACAQFNRIMRNASTKPRLAYTTGKEIEGNG